MAFVVWNEWITIHQLQCRSVFIEDFGPIRWEKPEVGWIKCNVYVAFVVGLLFSPKHFVELFNLQRSKKKNFLTFYFHIYRNFDLDQLIHFTIKIATFALKKSEV
jgi:hypothetical protein